MSARPVVGTREDWLNAAVVALRPIFAARGYEVPTNLRVSCGWPGGGSRNKRIGECWPAEASKDGTFEVFISPRLADGPMVMATLVHELVHPTVGLKEKHNNVFAKCARAVHLTGKMTSTVAGEGFDEKIMAPVMKAVGSPYPHAALGSNPLEKKQSTRMLKCVCKECGYTVRTTAKWLDTIGPPICPCNEYRMEVK